MLNWKIIIPSYFILLFLTRYYEFFYIYQPLNTLTIETGYTPTMGSFISFNYFLKVILYSLKFMVVSCVIYAGIFLEGKTNKTDMASLKDIFLLVVSAEFVFILRDLIEIVDFTFINTKYTKEEFQNFSPLSLFSFSEIDSTSAFTYLLQTVNLFELGYIGVLTYGLKELQYSETRKAVVVASSSYGSLLFIWILIVTYFSI